TTADAQERVHWKRQSAFPSNLPHSGVAGKRVEAMVERLSGGNFVLKFYEPGALVPALECFDAASKGSVEACWTTPAFNTGKYPALAFFSTVPFGPSTASSSPGRSTAAATSCRRRSMTGMA
ncbi:MAG TPA: hypothetical protein VHK45_00940, partial [Geminicoccaceae bacterium]|nr:hypothetical protein [Geminicoccaceae bacterium]